MIYDKFENLQMFPKIGSDLSKRVTFHTNYKYIIWKNFIIIYMVKNDYLEIYRVINRYQDITKFLIPKRYTCYKNLTYFLKYIETGRGTYPVSL